MNSLSIVMPYYENPSMLTRHYLNWASFPPLVRERIEVVIVDDGSPLEPAIDVPRPEEFLPALRIYRVLEDRPWHQHAARNLGAHVASGQWLLLTDMDHVAPLATIKRILQVENKSCAYTLERVEAATGLPTLDYRGRKKPHPNSFVLTRKLYWRAGGYDETFCGIYGTDGLFRRRLFSCAARGHLHDAPLIRFTRDIIPDASTRGVKRKEGRADGAKDRVMAAKLARGEANKILTLNFPWERIL